MVSTRNIAMMLAVASLLAGVVNTPAFADDDHHGHFDQHDHGDRHDDHRDYRHDDRHDDRRDYRHYERRDYGRLMCMHNQCTSRQLCMSSRNSRLASAYFSRFTFDVSNN